MLNREPKPVPIEVVLSDEKMQEILAAVHSFEKLLSDVAAAGDRLEAQFKAMNEAFSKIDRSMDEKLAKVTKATLAMNKAAEKLRAARLTNPNG